MAEWVAGRTRHPSWWFDTHFTALPFSPATAAGRHAEPLGAASSAHSVFVAETKAQLSPTEPRAPLKQFLLNLFKESVFTWSNSVCVCLYRDNLTLANLWQKLKSYFSGFLNTSIQLHDANRLFFFLYLETTQLFQNYLLEALRLCRVNAFPRRHATHTPGVRRAWAAVAAHVFCVYSDLVLDFGISAETKAATWRRIIYMPKTRLCVVWDMSYIYILH